MYSMIRQWLTGIIIINPEGTVGFQRGWFLLNFSPGVVASPRISLNLRTGYTCAVFHL